jgi:predicted nucleic acid-binding protein
MRAYADSNFLVRLHLATSGYEEAKELVLGLGRQRVTPLPICWLHRAEVTNAFQYHVFLSRKGMDVRVTPEVAAAALVAFEEDVEAKAYLAAAAIPPPQLTQRAKELSARHTAKHGFRTYDLLHVASALLLECDTFWSFDEKANRLAALEGLAIRTGTTRRKN